MVGKKAKIAIGVSLAAAAATAAAVVLRQQDEDDMQQGTNGSKNGSTTQPGQTPGNGGVIVVGGENGNTTPEPPTNTGGKDGSSGGGSGGTEPQDEQPNGGGSGGVPQDEGSDVGVGAFRPTELLKLIAPSAGVPTAVAAAGDEEVLTDRISPSVDLSPETGPVRLTAIASFAPTKSTPEKETSIRGGIPFSPEAEEFVKSGREPTVGFLLTTPTGGDRLIRVPPETAKRIDARLEATNDRLRQIANDGTGGGVTVDDNVISQDGGQGTTGLESVEEPNQVVQENETVVLPRLGTFGKRKRFGQ